MRTRGAGRVAGLLIAATALAACMGESDDPPAPTPPPIDATLVDGKVCGLFDEDLVISLIGHKDVEVRGSGIGDAAKRESNTIDCQVVDQERSKTPILVVVAEKPEGERAATVRMLAAEQAGKTDCSQSAEVEDFGPGYVCTFATGQVNVNVLLAKRMIRLTYLPGPDAPGDHLTKALELVKDVDVSVDAYDRKHG